jgi:hypothetical protein
MKRIILLSMLICSLTSQAQALFTLEKTLDGQFNVQATQYDDDNNFVEQLPYLTLTTPPCEIGYYYDTSCSGNTFTINLVSPDYQVSTKQYTFELPSGHELYSCYPTNKLTADKSLVFLITTRKGSVYSSGLYDVKGKLIQSFINEAFYANAYPVLYRINGSYKLLIWKGSLSGSTVNYKTDIYTFNNQSSGIRVLDAKELPLQPILSNNSIYIPFSGNSEKNPMLILDSNGIQVETKILTEENGTAEINVTHYRPGVYIYKIGKQTGKFVVN